MTKEEGDSGGGGGGGDDYGIVGGRVGAFRQGLVPAHLRSVPL